MLNNIINKGYALVKIKHDKSILNTFKKLKNSKYKSFKNKGY